MKSTSFKCFPLTQTDPDYLFHTANRVSTMHDFGYVALNLKYVYPEDSGTYTCRAVNELGQAVTSAVLLVQCK